MNKKLFTLNFILLTFGMVYGGSFYSQPDSLNVRFVGNWPFGPSMAVEIDSTRNLVFCGSGGGVYILDVSDPKNIRRLSDRIRTRGWVSGFFYDPSLLRLYIADGEAGVEIWDVRDMNEPKKMGYYNGDAEDIVILGSYAYVASGWNGFQILDITNPSHLVQVGYLQFDGGPAWAIAISGNYAYIAGGGIVYVVDISNPTNPIKVGSYPWGCPVAAMDIEITGSYAYIIGAHGLTIVDISNPQNLVVVSRPLEEDLSSITISGSYAYIVGGYDGNELWILDVTDKAHPILKGHYYPLPHNPGVTGEIKVYRSYAYITYWEDGLLVVDVSDPSNPQKVNSYDTPDIGRGVRISGYYGYLAEMFGLRIIDVSNPLYPNELGFCNIPLEISGIEISNSYAYLIGGYYGGLRIIDISNPANPVLIGSYDTLYQPTDIAVSDSYAYITTGRGLEIIDVSNPSEPLKVGYLQVEERVRGEGVAVSNPYAYITASNGRFSVIDVSDPSNPIEVGHCYGPEGKVVVSNSYAYATNPEGFSIIDISLPSNPVEVSKYHLPVQDNVRDIAIWEPYIFVGCAYSGGLRVVDISNPSEPVEVGFYTPSGGSMVDVSELYIYIAGTGLQIYEFMPPGVEEEKQRFPSNLLQIYPNPIIRGHMVKIQIPRGIKGNLKVYDTQGRLVRTLLRAKDLEPRVYTVNWDGRDDRGILLSSGLYWIVLEDTKEIISKKLVTLR